ncbi:MAG: hypothetical protein PHE59_02150 [Patescibacteria group bacterium]|nr:hypothetical protein [Patescibacteria group bacterium]MDD5164751.1 hypothetical protein [Patescibacteria group bacterium]MDD5534584.1 hypothetical protein [Patescibacteria group bacterium]
MRNFLKLGVLVVLGFIFCSIFLTNQVRAEVNVPNAMTITQSTNIDSITSPKCCIIADSIIFNITEKKVIIKNGILTYFNSKDEKSLNIVMKEGVFNLDNTWNTIYSIKNFSDIEVFTVINGKYKKIIDDKLENY